MTRLVAVILLALFLAAPSAARDSSGTPAVQALASKLSWRNIGPFIGGRVVAVAGVPSDPRRFYFGGVQGGVWRTTDNGTVWQNISDGKIPSTAQTMGAIAVAPSNSKIIYAGSGERDIRGDVDTGDGLYKTTDDGKTWHYAGLRETHTTSAIAIDPKDPNIVYVASMGHVFRGNPERGIFKTTDGGATWKKILYVNDLTGGIELVMDPTNARTLYASMWQAQRVPWKLTSGGAGSGLYKSTDAGAHWTSISKNPGFAQGVLGRMGIGVAATNPRVVYAIVQAHQGGVFRSNDGGATWQRTNDQMKLRQRAFYYMTIHVDPTNANVAYIPEVDDVFKTTDGGHVWKPLGMPGGDHHIIWINPRNPKILLEGDDGGAQVSTNGGKTWSSENNQPTGQYYHIALDRQFPFHVYGAAQDEGAFEGPSATSNGFVALGDWHTVASGESTFVAPEPGNADVTYGSNYFSTMFRQDNKVGQAHNVTPYATYSQGANAAETKYRFGWTHPVMFSPANDKELLTAAQVVFSTTDRGETWTIISPDLTRNDKSTEGPTGGPIDLDQTGAETFPDIESLAVSPLDANHIWAGSQDGLVHVSNDHGLHWTDVTPKALPQWAEISSIEPSHTTAGTAYLTASRYMWDDFHPYVYMTTDNGAHWTPITSGLPNDQYALAVRQDPREPRLLVAGTRSSVYMSLNGGQSWQSLALNLPGAQMRDLAFDARQGELALATHGRGVWLLDNVALLEQLAHLDTPTTATAQLFAPERAWLSHFYGVSPFLPTGAGMNPPYGATVFFNLPSNYDGKTPATLTFTDAKGATVRSFTLHLKKKKEKKLAPEVRYELNALQLRGFDLSDKTAATPGMNRFQWDMRYEPATEVTGFRAATADVFSEFNDGPTIVPGTYSVTLRYGTTTVTQPLELALDPGMHPADGDLDARLALEMRIHDTINQLDTAINAAMAAEAKAPPAKRAALQSAIGALVQLNIHSSEGDLLHETQIHEQLAFLGNELETAYEKPTAAEMTAFDGYQKRAMDGIARLQALAAR